MPNDDQQQQEQPERHWFTEITRFDRNWDIDVGGRWGENQLFRARSQNQLRSRAIIRGDFSGRFDASPQALGFEQALIVNENGSETETNFLICRHWRRGCQIKVRYRHIALNSAHEDMWAAASYKKTCWDHRDICPHRTSAEQQQAQANRNIPAAQKQIIYDSIVRLHASYPTISFRSFVRLLSDTTVRLVISGKIKTSEKYSIFDEIAEMKRF